MTVGLGDIDARADGGGHRLLDEVDPAGPSLDARVDDGPLLHLGNAGGNADNNAGLKEAESSDLTDKLLEHPLSHIVIRDNALPQGTDGNDVARSTAQHLLGVGAHLQELAGILVDGYHRRLPQNHALALDVDQNGRGAQIDTNIFTKHTHYLLSYI